MRKLRPAVLTVIICGLAAAPAALAGPSHRAEAGASRATADAADEPGCVFVALDPGVPDHNRHLLSFRGGGICGNKVTVTLTVCLQGYLSDRGWYNNECHEATVTKSGSIGGHYHVSRCASNRVYRTKVVFDLYYGRRYTGSDVSGTTRCP